MLCACNADLKPDSATKLATTVQARYSELTTSPVRLARCPRLLARVITIAAITPPSKGSVYKGSMMKIVDQATGRLLSGQKIDTAQARTWGLVQYVVEPAELDPLVDRLAGTAIQSDADHLAAMKRLCRGV